MLLAADVARRFYLDGRSKVEIAEEFGLSRFKVARVLDLARESGIVRIDVRIPGQIDAELSSALRSAYGLRRAIAVRTVSDSPQSQRSQIGAVAAELLTEIVEEDDVLGLAWGRTLNVVLQSLTRLPRCTTVQVNGVYSQRVPSRGAVETVKRAAELSGGTAYPIYAPLILPDPDTARALRTDPGVATAFSWFDRISKAVVSIGAWSPDLSTVHDALDPTTRDSYRELGVRAEMSTHLFDARANEVRTDLADRVLTIGTEELRRVPEVIAMAAGEEKEEAIDIVLRTGLVSTLVTDATVARRLVAGREMPVEC
ncbi:sugar-binding transcriptional regulator [Halostreptopolyspora alba]|uniref:Transcriptional regulator n=1 Tax=Halostreptopolyspora alba TaxID=2487137 RepID=A0A3N0EBA3_9ACTN|nr:transcriptional regulator [Nocardiopsaceae bacterium YIM 96095]